jgi:hypothetical protein
MPQPRPDDDRLFPERAYAPGREPRRPAPLEEPPPEQILDAAEIMQFSGAALLLLGFLGLVSLMLMAG